MAAKFGANVARDRAVQGALLSAGWRVAAIGERALRTLEQASAATERLWARLLTEADTLDLGEREVAALTKSAQP